MISVTTVMYSALILTSLAAGSSLTTNRAEEAVKAF
jgi:hypothetical protein